MAIKKYGKVFFKATIICGAVLPLHILAEDLPLQPSSNLPQALRQPQDNSEDLSTSIPVEKNVQPISDQARPAKRTFEYKVPCLTVRGDETHGKISYLPMKFSRTSDDKPLRVMISDDTPSGSGQSIHSSVWLAAVTAAMLRNDTMHGVTISVEFSGNVDGPSAGGVTCLALLSAIDGRELPQDFAMTGTILPDGTIGVVGGVPEKMRAAAKAGVKRIFIPAFLRIFKNSKGEDVDLSRLADELKVELHRVENISEAYAILHNLPYSDGDYVNVRSMTKLPHTTEDLLVAGYKDLHEKVKAKLKAHPKLATCYIIDDYVLSPELAENFYQEGKLIPATQQIFRSWQAWQAWEKTDAFLENFYKDKNLPWDKIKYLREYHLRKLILAFREEVDKQAKSCFDEKQRLQKEYVDKHYKSPANLHGYFPFREGQTEITAQLEPVSLEPVLGGKLQMLAMRRPEETVLSQASLKELDSFWKIEVDVMRLIFLSTLDSRSFDDFLGKLGDTLPKIKANKRAAEVERLFYSAACAADSVAGENFQSSLAAQADSGRKNTAENEAKRNPVMNPFLEMQKQAFYCHSLMMPDSDEKATNMNYHLQAFLKNQVTTFAMASAMLVMYGADQSNDFLPHLWRNARNAAIRNINECVKSGIPCFPAICDFESAEASENSNNDKVYSLISYWRASLYSKALLMSFKNN